MSINLDLFKQLINVIGINREALPVDEVVRGLSCRQYRTYKQAEDTSSRITLQ